jgi:hypothetical protein
MQVYIVMMVLQRHKVLKPTTLANSAARGHNVSICKAVFFFLVRDMAFSLLRSLRWVCGGKGFAGHCTLGDVNESLLLWVWELAPLRLVVADGRSNGILSKH